MRSEHRWLLATVALTATFAAACSSSPAGGSNSGDAATGGISLTGTWIARPGTFTPFPFMTFHSDGTFEGGVESCDSSGLKEQITSGTYSLSGDVLSLTPERSSCPGQGLAGSYSIDSYDGGSLLLGQTPPTLTPFERDDTDAGCAGPVSTGCFSLDGGGFVAQPVQTVP